MIWSRLLVKLYPLYLWRKWKDMNGSKTSSVRHEDSPSGNDTIKIDDRWSITIQRFDIPLHHLEQVFTQEHLTKLCRCLHASYVGRNHTYPGLSLWIFFKVMTRTKSASFRFMARVTTMTTRTLFTHVMLFWRPKYCKSVVFMNIASPSGSFWDQR